MDPVPVIEVKAVHKSFKTVHAVKGIDLQILKGQFVALLGPNGAGKTTLMEMIEGIQKPDQGEIYITGKKWRGNEDELHQIIGISLQETRYIDKLTVWETLKLFSSFFNFERDRVDEIIDIVGLEEKRKSYVVNLSGGQRQRLAMGIALLNSPKILLLDEPTTGLDPRGMSEVRDIIKALKGKNRLIFMSSHILSEVSDVCDEVAMINHGKLIIYDTLPHVTAKFSGGNNVVEVGLMRPVDSQIVTQTIAAMPDVVTAEKIDDKDLKISFSGGLAVQERLLNDIVKLNIGVVSYKAASSELEGVYLKLITATL